jgi:pimeloyl-ACP methyl ester carboxylesterase
MLTPQNWLSPPTAVPSWASLFLSAGHSVFIPDQPLRGRSPVPPGGYPLSAYSAEYISRQFTASQGWPQASLHTQWPGTGVPGDAIFDAFYSTQASFEGNGTLQQERMKAGLVELIETIGEKEDTGKGTVVVAHSQAGLFAWALADAVGRHGLRGLVVLEPSGPPFENAVFSRKPARKWGLTDIPLTYKPTVSDPATELKLVRAGEETEDRVSCLLQQEGTVKVLEKIKEIPVLLVTAEASYHAVYDHCTVAFLRQAGVGVEFLELWKWGQRGNGHMMFMERNGAEIWKLVERWVRKLK